MTRPRTADFEYEPDERAITQRLDRARKDVERFVTEPRTYGAIARTFPEHGDILNEVLLSSPRLEWDPNAPAPSRVTRVGK